MRKIVLWLIPTIVLVCSVSVNAILNSNEIHIELIELAVFIVCLYGIVFIAPCFYVVIIKLSAYNKTGFVKSICCAVVCIFLNAVIMCPKSILYYLGVLQRKYHDLDLLPMYTIIPIGIIVIGVSVILISKLIKNERDR